MPKQGDRYSQNMEQIEMNNETRRRGRLKIYFSYASGTGKTCTMLRDAHARRQSGIDVLVGYVLHDNDPEIKKLLDTMEKLPVLSVRTSDGSQEEFDLDSAITRRPQLAIVDDLAHSNSNRCRHRKRYQDIEELLRAGIDVYTCVNIQHIESLNDIVTSIIGMQEEERIPDSVFDNAEQVIFVDREPAELFEWYKQQSADMDTDYKEVYDCECLTALRELALRRAADRVSKNARKEGTFAADQGRHAEDHILTCISGAPSNAKVIRAAARMADAFHGGLTALFVETGDIREQDSESWDRLTENLKLAQDLGARIATVYGGDAATQIAEYAKASGISKIVIGRSGERQWWLPGEPMLVERLIAQVPKMDIYIIPETQQPAGKRRREKLNLTLTDLGRTLGILCLTSLVGLWFYHVGFSEANIITVYILGAMLTAMSTRGRLYGGIASFINVVIFNFLFVEPRFTLLAYNTGYLITFLVMFIASFTTSTLTMRVKDQAGQSAKKAYRTEVLLETSQKLQRAKSEEEIFDQTAHQMIKLLGSSVLFYPVSNQQLGEPIYFARDGELMNPNRYQTQEERTVAEWVYRNNKHAGVTTGTHSGAKCLYLAVRSQSTVFAVAGIVMEGFPEPDAFEKNLLITMLGECALALEKEQLSQTKNRMEMQAQQEQLRANLLRAISHDLRTPLTIISGNAGILMENKKVLSESKKQRLYADIYDDSMWLINLVENLLSVTRIENGTMNIHIQPELLDEVIQEALVNINRRNYEHTITVSLEDDLLMAWMDSRLIIQVIINIVDNAIKYTPIGSHISIGAKREKEMVLVEIADDGGGINEEQKERLFDMFFSSEGRRSDHRRGLGLGLFLCKAIIHAHGGDIYFRDNFPRGSVFCFTLQAEEVDLSE